MKAKIVLYLALLPALPICAQVAPAGIGDNPYVDEAYRMPIPPLVDAKPFPMLSMSEERENYLQASLRVEPAYTDNVLSGNSAKPQSDTSYSVLPYLSFDHTSARLHLNWNYAPDMQAYEKISARNSLSQYAVMNGEYRLTRHTTFSFSENFVKSDNVFGQPFNLLGQPTTGASTESPTDVVAPFIEHESNSARVEASYQPTRNALIGVGAESSLFEYPNLNQAKGLGNSDTISESAFYSRRLRGNQYAGLTYEHTKVMESSSTGDVTIRIHNLLPFYMLSIGKGVSFTVSSGPQYYQEYYWPVVMSAAWSPSATVSLSWQMIRTNIAVTGSRSVTGGGGLLGEYETDAGNAMLRQRLSRNWFVQTSGGYIDRKNASNSLFMANRELGHTVTSSISIDHTLSGRITTRLGYEREHLNYSQVSVIAIDPDVNRVSFSISYQLRRSIGR